MKEFIIIPLLFIIYFYAFNFLISNNFSVLGTATTGGVAGGGVEAVGLGDFATVQVTRPYLFGLYRLPVYTSSLGDISIYHNAFFVVVLLVTSFLIYRKIKLRNRYSWQHTTHF